MKENIYDKESFFEKYGQMTRSQMGLQGAGEWETLKKLLPDFKDKRVLDIGCGYGWHCIYAMEQGAASVVGIDLSEKMLEVAREKTQFSQVEYRCMAMEDMDFAPQSFDVVLSSLAFHYAADFDMIVKKVFDFLKPGGEFIFSVEHPVFTAQGSQDWHYAQSGEIMHFPVDRYFDQGKRTANFLGEAVVKYHKTLTTYVNALLKNGFLIRGLEEPQPTAEMLREIPGMQEELRRPMMLILAAQKG